MLYSETDDPLRTVETPKKKAASPAEIRLVGGFEGSEPSLTNTKYRTSIRQVRYSNLVGLRPNLTFQNVECLNGYFTIISMMCFIQ